MEFTEKELEVMKFVLDYFYDADLSEFGHENIRIVEGIMEKLGMKFSSQIND